MAASLPTAHSPLRTGLAASAVCIFYTYLDSYAFALGGPKTWLLVLVFAVGAIGALAIDPHRQLSALRSPIFLWVILYFGMLVAWVPLMQGYDEVWHVLNERCTSLVLLLSLLVIFDDYRARRVAILAVVACIVLASALNVAEFTRLLSFTAGPERIPGRASGFHFNPNSSALAITMGLALVAEQVPMSWRAPLVVVSAVGVAATFSRGGMVCLVLVFMWLVWRKGLGTWSIAVGLLLGACLLIFAVDYVASNALLTEDTVARLQLAGGDSGRTELALKAWNMFLTSPWIGHGMGATVTWDEQVYAHNMYVTLAAEHGILGLLAFPAFGLAIIGGNRAALCFVMVLLIGGFFSHTLLDSHYVLLLVALASGRAPGVSA